MSTTEQRGAQIYDHLRTHLNQPFTRAALLEAVGLEPGAKTDRAMWHARALATADGYDFPPAVPENGYIYVVTDQAIDSIEPQVHTLKIGFGIQHRIAVLMKFIGARAATLQHPRLRQVMADAAALQAEKAAAVARYDAQLAGLMAEAQHIIRYEINA